MSLIVEDPDAVADRPVAAGGNVVFPVADQPYGMRQGGSQTRRTWLSGKNLR